MLISATFMAYTINPRLYYLLVAIPVLGIGLYFIASKAFPLFKAMLKKFDGLNASVQENLIGIRVVKAFVEDHENEKFRKTANDLCDARVKAENMLIYNMPLMQFVMYACMVAISWFGGNMIIRGTMETGQLMSFISYVSQILISLMMISMAFVMLVISRASIVRIVEILDEDIDVKDDQGDPGLKLNDGSIVFDNKLQLL